MKRKLFTIILVVLVITLFIASHSFAEPKENAKNATYTKSDLKAGTKEISVSYSGAYNTAGLRPFIGYFVSDEIEIGGGFLVETGDYEGNDYTTTALNLVGRYHIPIEQNMVLFGELGIEQVNVDEGSGGADITSFLLGVGARVFPSKDFCMNLTLDYVVGSYDTQGVDVDTDSVRAALGLSVFVF